MRRSKRHESLPIQYTTSQDSRPPGGTDQRRKGNCAGERELRPTHTSVKPTARPGWTGRWHIPVKNYTNRSGGEREPTGIRIHLQNCGGPGRPHSGCRKPDWRWRCSACPERRCLSFCAGRRRGTRKCHLCYSLRPGPIRWPQSRRLQIIHPAHRPWRTCERPGLLRPGRQNPGRQRLRRYSLHHGCAPSQDRRRLRSLRCQHRGRRHRRERHRRSSSQF